MTRNEMQVHLDDKQLAELKKSMQQVQRKDEAEMHKILKSIEQMNHKINDIILRFDFLNPDKLSEDGDE